jgi:hypothetical protein
VEWNSATNQGYTTSTDTSDTAVIVLLKRRLLMLLVEMFEARGVSGIAWASEVLEARCCKGQDYFTVVSTRSTKREESWRWFHVPVALSTLLCRKEKELL